jgi:hypothetical protein
LAAPSIFPHLAELEAFAMKDLAHTIVVLTPAESKRLLARAVAQMPEVQQALSHGRLIIGHGTTNACVAEELLGESISKWHYAAGVIVDGRLDVTENESRLPPVALYHGKSFGGDWTQLLQDFGRNDVFIKGGNAIDPEGNVGVLLGSPVGGTVGQILGLLSARGSHLIAPIGLEKLVPDVIEAARHCGIGRLERCDGLPVGMAVLTNATAITEIEAFELLCGVQAWHIASGGIGGSEGAVTLALAGGKEPIDKACELAEFLAGADPIGRD